MDKYQETFTTWNKIAQLYEDIFMDMTLYKESYDRFLDGFSQPSPTILEVGCGPGMITKYLLSKKPELKLLGVDISENMVTLAKKNNPSASFEVMDARDLKSLNTGFDGIISGFALPYLSEEDVTAFIKASKHLLSEKGFIYLSFVNGDPANSGFIKGSSGDKTFFYYHSKERLVQQLENEGFSIIQQMNIEYLKNNNAFEMHSVVIARKNP